MSDAPNSPADDSTAVQGPPQQVAVADDQDDVVEVDDQDDVVEVDDQGVAEVDDLAEVDLDAAPSNSGATEPQATQTTANETPPPRQPRGTLWRKANGKKRIYMPMSTKKALLHNARWGETRKINRLLEKAKTKSEKSNKLELFDQLINVTDRGPGVTLPYKHPTGKNAMMRAAVNGHADTVQVLLNFGARIDDQDQEEGSTALILATAQNHINVATKLIDAKATLDIAKQSDGKSALSLACENAFVEIVTSLLASNANVEHKDKEGDTPLALAARNGHVDIMKILLNRGARIDSTNNKNETPLNIAVCSHQLGACELLINSGCSMTIKNKDGRTALDSAVQMQFTSVERLITEAVKVRRAADLPRIREQRRQEMERRKSEERQSKEARRRSRQSSDAST